jgi:hypothetical protein
MSSGYFKIRGAIRIGTLCFSIVEFILRVGRVALLDPTYLIHYYLIVEFRCALPDPRLNAP